MNDTKTKYLTTEEVAQRLGVTILTVQRAARAGRFPGAQKITPDSERSQWRIPEDALSA